MSLQNPRPAFVHARFGDRLHTTVLVHRDKARRAHPPSAATWKKSLLPSRLQRRLSSTAWLLVRRLTSPPELLNEIDLVVLWIFEAVGNRIGYECELRALGVGSNLLDFIGTGRDRPGKAGSGSASSAGVGDEPAAALCGCDGAFDRYRPAAGRPARARASESHLFHWALLASSALLESGNSAEKKICAPSADQAKACTFSFSLYRGKDSPESAAMSHTRSGTSSAVFILAVRQRSIGEERDVSPIRGPLRRGGVPGSGKRDRFAPSSLSISIGRC